jgi:hypothetical protein
MSIASSELRRAVKEGLLVPNPKGFRFIKHQLFSKLYPRSKQLPSNDLDACRYHVGTKPLVSVGTIQTKKSAIKGARPSPFRYLGLVIVVSLVRKAPKL